MVGPQGVPIGAPEGGQMTGLGGPTTAQSQLAGVVGGALQSGPVNRAAAAGGVIPEQMNTGVGG
jgi:hypothetical protein